MLNRSLIVHALVGLVSLIASAEVGCAMGVIDAEADAQSPARTTEPAPSHRRDEQARDPLMPARTHEAAMAMAASLDGIVLFDVATSDVAATATTTYPVEDLAYDPWRDRWIVVEYEDASANQVSVWRTVQLDPDRIGLSRDSVIETGGYCRVAATRSGAVIFEDDGLHQRWLITGDDLATLRQAIPTAIPSSLVVRESPFASRLFGLVLRDQKADPTVSWSVHELDGQGLLAGSEEVLPAWSKHLSPPRIAAGRDGSFVVAQTQEPGVRIGVVDDSGQDILPPVELAAASESAVEDVLVDRVTDTAFVLLSGANVLEVVHVQSPNERATVSVPGGVSPGSFWAMGRMMALDEGTGTLLVGNNGAIVAFELPETSGAAPERIGEWYGDAWRWPVVIASRGE
ncbi:MAG: hypothetical protein HY898_24620 [Deltaproteobacteria bacterium]|nr:hypothetical protein [Deltaproteobacteria bacterium]